MSSPEQIEANRTNAQSSTGPQTEAGKQRSALNATRHGYTGQSLVLTAPEKEAYEFHCLSFMDKYAPATHEETELTQQYCDLLWGVHQIAVQQSNLLSALNTLTTQLMNAGEPQTVTAAIAPLNKTLGTYSTYENRKRRAADDVLDRLKALQAARRAAVQQAAPVYKANKAQGKPWKPAEFGFVCSEAEIETFLRREATAAEVKKLLATPKV